MLETIETILSVIGAVSLVLGVIRFIWVFSVSGTEWIDNMSIKVEPWDEEFDPEEYFAFNGDHIYPTVYTDKENVTGGLTVNYFIPQNAIIRRLKIKRTSTEDFVSGKMRYKKVQTIKTVTPEVPLCMVVDRPDLFARYMIEWKTQYGGKARYYLDTNLRSNAYNRSGIQYSFGIWARVRKYFGLI